MASAAELLEPLVLFVEVLFSAKLNASALCGALCGSCDGLRRELAELLDADDGKEEGVVVELIFELLVVIEKLFCCCC